MHLYQSASGFDLVGFDVGRVHVDLMELDLI